MQNPGKGEVKVFTLELANAALPQVRELLARLREIKRGIVAAQARVDLEELVATGGKRPVHKIEPLLKGIETQVHQFHQCMDHLHALGCEMKDLEKGLVDFYGLRGKELVYLCWQEGEQEIRWWHPLQEGFSGRRPIEGEGEIH